MAPSAPHVAFIDEAGVPEIPALAKKPIEPIFCIGLVFMPMHYWLEMQNIYNQARIDFGIPIDQELKWRNLRRGTGPAAHLQGSGAHPFIEELVKRIDPSQFHGVAVTVVKDNVYRSKHYIKEGQDIYNAAILFALQRLQNEFDEAYGPGAHCPCIIIADSRQKGGQDNRLRKFVDNAMGGTGGLWVNFDRTLVEGILFQVSHYSVGLQIADFLAGAVFQKDARNDERYFNLWRPVLRKSSTGSIHGYGYVYWYH